MSAQRISSTKALVPVDRAVRSVISLGHPADIGALRLSGAPAEVRAAVPIGRIPIEDLVSWGRYGPRVRPPGPADVQV